MWGIGLRMGWSSRPDACSARERSHHPSTVRPRESGDPGQQTRTLRNWPLDSRLRGNERRVWLDWTRASAALLRRRRWRQRLAQDVERAIAAVERAIGAALDLPAVRGAHELPTVRAHAVDAIALRDAVRGHLDRLGGWVRGDDLQIGCRHRAVAVDRHVRQAGKMRKPGPDRRLMRRALRHRRDGLAAGRGLVAAKIEHAVLREDRANVGAGGGIGARRMAGNEVVDRELILDRAQAILDRALLWLRHAFLPVRGDAAMTLAAMPRWRIASGAIGFRPTASGVSVNQRGSRAPHCGRGRR